MPLRHPHSKLIFLTYAFLFSGSYITEMTHMSVDYHGITPPDEDVFLVYIILEGVPHNDDKMVYGTNLRDAIIDQVVYETSPSHISHTGLDDRHESNIYFGYPDMFYAADSLLRVRAVIDLLAATRGCHPTSIKAAEGSVRVSAVQYGLRS